MSTKIDTIDRALELLAAAQEAAGDTIYSKRVDQIVNCLEPLKELREKLAVGRKDAPRAVAVERNRADLQLDGKLDEAFWKDVPVYDLKQLTSGDPPLSKTTFQAVWSDRSLVLGIRCEDADMANVSCWATQDGDPSIYNDDLIELFLETPLHVYYSIAINSAGVILDMDRQGTRNARWSAEAERAISKDDQGWTLEIRIPTSTDIEGGLDPLKKVEGRKPTTEEPWFFNVCRQRIRDKYRELSAFSPTGGSRFGNPDKFAELVVE